MTLIFHDLKKGFSQIRWFWLVHPFPSRFGSILPFVWFHRLQTDPGFSIFIQLADEFLIMFFQKTGHYFSVHAVDTRLRGKETLRGEVKALCMQRLTFEWKPKVARHSRVLLCWLLSPDLLLCSDSLSCCLPSSSSHSVCSNNCTEIGSILGGTRKKCLSDRF